jgi:hypothetical protein
VFVPGRQHALKTTTIDILKNYFQLANKSISDIDIKVDPFNNQVQVSFDVKNGEYTAQIPLSLITSVRILNGATAKMLNVYEPLTRVRECERLELFARFSSSNLSAKLPGCMPENSFLPNSPT